MKFPASVRVRYIVCFVAWYTLVVFYEYRSNMSINIVAMVKPESNNPNQGADASYSSCINSQDSESGNNESYGDFNWDKDQQNFILSGFFYGYICTHLIGSFISLRIGLRITMIGCLAGSTLFTFLTVPFAYLGYGPLLFCRIMTGVFSGPLYPIMHETLGHWSPSSERTVLSGLTHTGNIVGLVFNFGVGGFIIGTSVRGWEILMYVGGGMGLLALVLWTILVFNDPSTDPFITKEERELIMRGISSHEAESGKEMFKRMPIKSILTSIPIYMISISHCGANFIIYAMLTGHAKYLHDVFGLSKSQSSYLSIIPFVSNFVVQSFWPFVADAIRRKTSISISTMRRGSTCLAFIGGAAFLIPVGYLPCDKIYLCVFLMSLSMAMIAMNQIGYFTAMLDLSPMYSGVIMGIANTFGSLAGILQPYLAKALTKTGDRKIGYQKTFLATSLISLGLGFAFVIFGTSEKQSWADGKEVKERQKQEPIL